MRSRFKKHLLIGSVLLACLCITFVLWQHMQQQAESELEAEFEFNAIKFTSDLEQRMSAYKQVLLGVRALFYSTPSVTRDDFKQYVSSLHLDEQHPGIQGLSYSPILAASQKAEHIKLMREQYYPNYNIYPDGEREIYTPVTYLEPLTERNARALGYDTYSETVRKTAQQQAIETGKLTITGKIKLVQETDEQVQAGFLMFLPVLSQVSAQDAHRDDTKNTSGFVTAVFRMGDLMQGLGDRRLTELEYQIYDGVSITSNTLMYTSTQTSGNSTLDDASLTSRQIVNIAEHNWTIVISTTPEFSKRVNTNMPSLIAFTGIVLSTLLSLLLNGYIRTNKIADDLKRSEARWRYALEGAGDGVWDWNIVTREISYSKQCKAMLGYAENEINNQYYEWEQRIHPDDLNRTLKDVKSHLDGESPSLCSEHRLKHKNGSWCWVLIRGMITSYNNNGLPLRMIGTLSDITDRKLVESQLKEQRDFNNAVVEAAGNIIVVLDLAGNFVEFNRAAEELTGFQSEEILGKPVWDWVIPEDQIEGVKKVFTNLKQGNFELASHYENDWLTADGNRRTLDWHNTIIRNTDGNVTHIIALGYDITERNKTERELIKLNATLEERVYERTQELEMARDQANAASMAKSHFLSNMSHEIRSPLGAIIGFSEYMIDDDFDADERKKIISTIVRNGKHLQQIINDILDISKIEADQLVLEYIDTSIFSIMGEADSLLGMTARDKGLNFKINYHFPLPENIVTDPTCLKQILVNLCTNAIKFTHEGYVSIDVSCTKDYKTIQFIVSDTGIGMTKKETEKVFEAFIQADATTTRKYGGTGLGLSISSRLATALDGKLTCESQKNHGSQFTLTITNHDESEPVVINCLEEVGTLYDEQRDQVEIKQLTGKVLIVEDSPDNQQLISMYIRKTGATINIVENGQQALDEALANKYDLILMDMQMPVMDGIQAISQLRAAGYAQPIVSLTANAMLSDREKCIAVGADDYLIKPIDLYLFYRVLNTYLHETNTSATNKTDIDLQHIILNSPQYQAIVSNFIQNLPQLLSELAIAREQKDWVTLEGKSHELKGMGGSMGYPIITTKAGELNDLVKQGAYSKLEHCLSDLASYCETILQTH